jgi:hypothetical protein
MITSFRLFLLAFLLINIQESKAQFSMAASSASFKEPEEGHAKILLLKNKNTAFIHVNCDGGIDIRLFDAQRKEIRNKVVATNYGKLKEGQVMGCFQINGDVTILIQELVGWTYAMYRVILDGNTGDKKEESTILKLNDFSYAEYKDVRKGNAPRPFFLVNKDPYSDNYAVGVFNSSTSEKDQRIHIVHYGKDHKEISNVFVTTSAYQKFEFCNLVDLVVKGNQEVMVLLFPFNTYKTSSLYNRRGELVMMHIANGQLRQGYTLLPRPNEREVSSSQLQFNKDYSKLYLNSLSLATSNNNERSYVSQILLIDPKTDSIREIHLENGNLVSQVHAKYPGAKGLNGTPVEMDVNDDGSLTILSESSETYSAYGDASAFIGNIVVRQYNTDGSIKGASVIFSNRTTNGMSPYFFYQNNYKQVALPLRNGNQYKFYSYIATPKGNFLFMNDLEVNSEINSKGEVKKPFQSVRDAYSFYYKIDDPIPSRNWLYPKPVDNTHPLSLFALSDYDLTSNIYCTTQLDHGGGGGNIKLVWLQP